MNIMGLGWFILVGSRMASLIHQFLQPEGMCEFFFFKFYFSLILVGTYVLLIDQPFIILEVCRVIGCSIVVTGAMVGIVERIIASILLDQYEQKTHTAYVLTGFVGSLPTTGIMTYFCEFFIGVFG